MPASHPPSLLQLPSMPSSSSSPTPARQLPSSTSSSLQPLSPTPLPSRAPFLQPLPTSPTPSTDPQLPYRERAIVLCIKFGIFTSLGLIMVIFLGIPAVMPPEFNIDPESSLSSFNVSVSHVTTQWNLALTVGNPSAIIAVHYTHVKVILSYDNRLTLSHVSVPAFTQPARNHTTVQVAVSSMLPIVNDMSVDSLVNSLKGGQAVSMDVAVKAKRRFYVGQFNWAVFDVCASCSDVIFTAPATGDSSRGASEWMLLGGTPLCNLDVFSQI